MWRGWALLLLLAAACSGSSGPNALTAAAPAIQASLTAEAASLAPTNTPEPAPLGSTAPPPAPSADTPVPLGPDPCAYDLLFLDDLTVPDGTTLRPGEPFDKRWKVQNAGTCAWGPDFRVVLVEGDPLGAPPEIALYPALPGADGIVRALMTAPQAAGDFSGTWSARDPQGNLFGNPMWVRITVVVEP